MAIICEKKIMCDKCSHLKYDEDNREWCCFAEQDGATDEYGVVRDTDNKEMKK